MSITHEELRHELQHLKLGRRLLGYDPKAIDMLLERLVASYEQLSEELDRLAVTGTELTAVTLERDELRLRVAELQTDSGISRELGALVRDTLISAQRAANELRSEARREATELRAEARKESVRLSEAARAKTTALAERDRLDEECRMLGAELRRLEEQLGQLGVQASLGSDLESLDDVAQSEADDTARAQLPAQ